MKAIQLRVAIALAVGVLMFVMKGGASVSITDEIMKGQDTSQELNTEFHDEIQAQKDSLGKRVNKLRSPEANYKRDCQGRRLSLLTQTRCWKTKKRTMH